MTEQAARRTQQQRRAETERRVLDAVTRLIARHGSHGVTLAEGGREAGYSRGIVHAAFGSRADLLGAVVRDAQQFAVPPVDGDGLALLAAVVRAYLGDVRDRQPSTGAFLLLWAESVAGEPVLAPLFAERDASFRAALTDIMRAGIADGSVRGGVDPGAVAAVLLGLLRGIGMQVVAPAGVTADEGFVRQVVDLLIRGIAA